MKAKITVVYYPTLRRRFTYNRDGDEFNSHLDFAKDSLFLSRRDLSGKLGVLFGGYPNLTDRDVVIVTIGEGTQGFQMTDEEWSKLSDAEVKMLAISNPPTYCEWPLKKPKH